MTGTPRVVHPIWLGQALPDRFALGEQECVRHAAAHDEEVHLGQKVFKDLDLVRDLGPTDDRGEWPFRMLQESTEGPDLGLHEQPGIRRQELGDADGGRMGTVGRPERVVDVDLGIGR
jgi:hypothetical protein